MGSEYQPNHETLAAPLAREDSHALASEAAGRPAALSRFPCPRLDCSTLTGPRFCVRQKSIRRAKLIKLATGPIQ